MKKGKFLLFLLCGIVCICSSSLFAVTDPLPVQPPSVVSSFLSSPNSKEAQDFLNVHSQLRIVALLTLLTLLPFAVMMLTSFTRILIVFHFVRQAVGTPQMPSNSLLVGLSIILTLFIMNPILQEVNEQAIQPYMRKEFANHPDVRMHLRGEDAILLEKSWTPIRGFLFRHLREKDLQLFLDMAEVTLPPNQEYELASPAEQAYITPYDLSAVPWYCLIPSFVLSELRSAFMMGFLLFIPFIVIDIVVASILMSMGMMMLPPVMISLPFKILLFIIIDGWKLVIERIVKGFSFPM